MKKGFTLVELLVVIAVIGILSAIITPNLLNARNSARIAAGQRFDSSVYHSIGDYLVGEWTFDIPTNTLLDTSGMGNTGSTTTDPVYYQTGGYNGKGAFYFDGTDDYINGGHNNSMQLTEAITISAWINPVNVSAINGIVDKWWDGSLRHISFQTNTTRLHFLLSSPAGADDISLLSESNLIKAGMWQHVVVTWDKNKIYFYVNGIRANTSGTKTTSCAANTQNWQIGKGWNGYLNGLEDDVRIYATALSSSEIEKLYAEGAETHGISLNDNL